MKSIARTSGAVRFRCAPMAALNRRLLGVLSLRTVESLQASLLMRNSPDYNTRGLHNMGQASVNLSHNPAWFHRKAIQEFRVQLTCTKESTMLIKGTALK